MAILLLAAVVSDVQRQRIPNWVVLVGMVLGLALNALMPEGFGFAAKNLPGGVGFLDALAGGGVALLVLLPMYLLRAMGAGDVKLMMMVGMFLGTVDLVWAVLWTFIAGGMLSVVYAMKVGVLRKTLGNVKAMLYRSAIRLAGGSSPAIEDAPPPAAKLPYAVAIATGTLGYLVWKSVG